MTDIDNTTTFYYICRLCALKLNIPGHSIFSTDGQLNEIKKKIEECLHFTINDSDKLPKSICRDCLYKLDNVYEFQIKCLESQHFLTELMKHDDINVAEGETLEVFDNQDFPCLELHDLPDTNTIHDLQHLVDHASINADNSDITKIIQYHDGEINDDQIHDIDQIEVTKIQNSSLLHKDTDDSLPDITLYSFDAISEAEEHDDYLNHTNFVIESVKLDNINENECNLENIIQLNDVMPVVKELDRPDENEMDENDIKLFTLSDINVNVRKKEIEPKICEICNKTFRSKYKLTQHQRTHTSETPFKCSKMGCNKDFRSKIGLVQHEAKHTGKYEFSCPICGKGFQIKSYLTIHMKVHSNLKPFKCNTCGLYFKAKQGLIDHENRHFGLKPYECKICSKKFITKALCISHEKTHTNSVSRPYPCYVCNKFYVSKSYLKTHMMIHSGKKRFICEFCGKGFLTRVDLKKHEPLHTKEIKYVCETCGKSFARRLSLCIHNRSHTGERPYKCKYCGQAFTQFSAMSVHTRLHTGEKPYKCALCSECFVSNTAMQTHYKKHNNLKNIIIKNEF